MQPRSSCSASLASGRKINVNVPSGVPLSEGLDALNRNLLEIGGRSVQLRDLMAYGHWSEAQAVAVMMAIQAAGGGAIFCEAFHRGSGAGLGRFPLSAGPPVLPVVVENEETGDELTIETVDDLEFEVFLHLRESVTLSDGER